MRWRASRSSDAGRWAAALGFVAALVLNSPVSGQERIDPANRLRQVREEIARLQREMRALGSRENSLLVELERLGTEMRLREAEYAEAGMNLEAVGAELGRQERTLERIETTQAQRRRYLGERVREIYKDGPDQGLRRLLGGDAMRDYLTGLRYAAYLNERDARVLGEFRSDALRLGEEREALLLRERELRESREELRRTGVRLASARANRERMLQEVRDDRSKRERALGELEGAADEMSRLVDSFAQNGPPPRLDVTKFRGLLDWPADGAVSAGFGSVIHPRFKTEVPHPGLDIEGGIADDIRAVFDGRVVYAEWMQGYGLTVILDHGSGVLSIYAHASALLVEAGEEILRGRTIGKIGETGSLRGPYLYFELRVDGRPVDPRGWLRPRR